MVPSFHSFFITASPPPPIFVHTTSTSFFLSLSPASLSPASLFPLRTESDPADVERHCEETGVFLHHWRHQQLRHAQQR